MNVDKGVLQSLYVLAIKEHEDKTKRQALNYTGQSPRVLPFARRTRLSRDLSICITRYQDSKKATGHQVSPLQKSPILGMRMGQTSTAQRWSKIPWEKKGGERGRGGGGGGKQKGKERRPGGSPCVGIPPFPSHLDAFSRDTCASRPPQSSRSTSGHPKVDLSSLPVFMGLCHPPSQSRQIPLK